MVVGELERHTIIENNTVFFKHDAVATHAGFETGEGTGVQHFQQVERVRSLDFKFAQWSAVVYGKAFAHS